MTLRTLILASALAVTAQVQSQSLPSAGTLVVVPAFGEVVRANDQAIVTFAVEEQDKDKNAAAARVNQKMKQGTEIVKKEDPQAQLKTQGYYTYPIYPEVRPLPNGTMPRPVPTGWRVGQYLEVKTSNLGNLPKLAAAAQKVLGLNNLQFGLSPETTRKLDDARIAAAVKNLNERIASIAAAMGRKVADGTLETVDFETTGRYAGADNVVVSGARMSAMKVQEQAMPEPSFEPGETTLQMNVVGKVRFK